jgi:hypothetical protein
LLIRPFGSAVLSGLVESSWLFCGTCNINLKRYLSAFILQVFFSEKGAAAEHMNVEHSQPLFKGIVSIAKSNQGYQVCPEVSTKSSDAGRLRLTAVAVRQTTSTTDTSSNHHHRSQLVPLIRQLKCMLECLTEEVSIGGQPWLTMRHQIPHGDQNVAKYHFHSEIKVRSFANSQGRQLK